LADEPNADDALPTVLGARAQTAAVNSAFASIVVNLEPRAMLGLARKRQEERLMSASRRFGSIATLLLLSSACVETYKIPPAQLQYLNGYNIHGEQSVNGATFTELPYRLISFHGQPVDYNSTKQLVLLGASQQQLAPSGPFESITLSENTFDAILLNGPPVQVPLQSIQTVEITEPSPQRTSQLTIALSVLASVILAGITVAVAH
jgi:hypothetical protein